MKIIFHSNSLPNAKTIIRKDWGKSIKQKYINGLKEKNFSRRCECNSESQCWDTSLRRPRLQILIKPSWTSCFVTNPRRACLWVLCLKFVLSPAQCSHLCLLWSLSIVPWASQTWKIYWCACWSLVSALAGYQVGQAPAYSIPAPCSKY